MYAEHTKAMKSSLILLVLIYGACAEVQRRLVGCENTPCQHQCVDTVDSYYCLCFENYVMQLDQHSCLHKNTDALEKAYTGCWSDDEALRDLPYRIWTRPDDATVSECMHDCNARGFDFAGLQNGDECWCGNTYHRAYEENAVCNIACPGAPAQLCGGDMASSIYKVNRDERYMGCFTEDPNDKDLPHFLWDETERKSIDECVTECGVAGYNYSGVFNGGQCSCGNSFGKHGSPGDEFCNVPCYDGYAGFNCGGNTTNAIYRVAKGTDLTGATKLGAVRFVDEETRADMQLSKLFLYPNTLGLYAGRVMIYASDTVNTIYDDATCTSGECYSLCGEIHTPPGFDKYSADVVIRRFHVKLTEIESLVAYPDKARRVYVFAQTVFFDASTSFPWSLYIRARQIVIDYEANPWLQFDHTGPTFPDDVGDAMIYGIPSDLTFQKLSLLCAQMLVSSEVEDYNRVGWNILDDMARDRSYTIEQGFFLDNVRAARTAFTSIGRNDMHWVPYFDKNHYLNTLENIYQQITIYNEEFEEMMDEFMECETFKDRASTLIGIWTDTVLAEAQIIMDYFRDNLQISKATYQGIIVEIQESIVELHAAKDKFIAGIKKAIISALVRGAMNGLVNVIDRFMNGKTPAGAKDAQDDIREASEWRVIIDGFDYIVEHLTKGNEQMYWFENIKDNILESEDFKRYIDNVEIIAQLEKLLPMWNNMTNQTDEVFTEPQFRNIEGALDFAFALYDLLNWGEALTRSLIEHAINIRNFIGAASMYKAKLEMKLRFDLYFAELQLDCNKQGMMAIRFAEQNYDLMLELNQQLIQFCQAFYYEEMVKCPEEARPHFEYSVTELLTTINQAKLLAGYFGRKSTAKLDVTIEDDPGAWANCTDAKICPIKMFRDNRTLYYPLPLDHPRFQNIDLFLIEEIEVYLNGASSSNSYSDCRVQITSSGPFYNRREGGVGTFISRALSGLLFQYDMNTGNIELYCNLYESSDGTIKHMSPFTTWLITIPDSHSHVDLSQLESVTMVFRGSFFN